jgi:hypothetical protein
MGAPLSAGLRLSRDGFSYFMAEAVRWHENKNEPQNIEFRSSRRFREIRLGFFNLGLEGFDDAVHALALLKQPHCCESCLR